MPKTAKNIYKRKDGRWEGRYPNGRKSDGKIKYKSVYGKTYQDVKAELDLVKSCSEKKIEKNTILFSEILESWMKLNSLHQKSATQLKYEYLIDKHIKPELGNYAVPDITEEMINNFLLSKLYPEKYAEDKSKFSKSYVKSMLFIIRATLKYSVELGYRNSINNSLIVSFSHRTEISVLSAKNQIILEDYVCKNMSLTGLGILISLNMGLRIGEVCALQWQDVDFTNRILHVRHTISRKKNEDTSNKGKTILTIDTPKTECSLRDIPITDKMNEIISNYSSFSDSSYVISGKETFISPRTYEYRFQQILKKSGIRHINYHVLRHTFATRCIEKGIDIKTLSEILGHASVNITLNTYVHSSIELKRKQLEKLYK